MDATDPSSYTFERAAEILIGKHATECNIDSVYIHVL